jgi:hypothetical protein
MDSLVTVRTFTYAHEAAIARSLLRAEEIFCFLKDELTIQANPFYSNALGGVKLQVRGQDADRAAEILKSFTTEEPQTITIRTSNGTLDECPACESHELSLIRKPSKRLFGLSLLFLGFPLSLFSSVYHCYGCCRDIKVTRR